MIVKSTYFTQTMSRKGVLEPMEKKLKNRTTGQPWTLTTEFALAALRSDNPSLEHTQLLASLAADFSDVLLYGTGWPLLRRRADLGPEHLLELLGPERNVFECERDENLVTSALELLDAALTYGIGEEAGCGLLCQPNLTWKISMLHSGYVERGLYAPSAYRILTRSGTYGRYSQRLREQLWSLTQELRPLVPNLLHLQATTALALTWAGTAAELAGTTAAILAPKT